MQNIQEFKNLGLSEKSLEAIQAKGFETPTEIQSRCIPVLLSGHGDLIGQAQTGTGKTAAFALPILEMLDNIPRKERTGNPKALILVPTRELCMQVCDEISSLAFGRDARACAIYGGASYNIQFKALKTGVDIVVGTPGRIQDHIERETLKLDELKVCVLDEADEMLDMGFIEDIENILSKTPEDRQMLCFSATMPEPILKLASKFMKDYELIKVQTQDMTSSLTKQIFYELYEEDKFEALRRTIEMDPNFYGLVFCKTKIQCDEIGASLISAGYNAEVLHGDLSQTQRELIVHRMREHRISILVATDVAARGIDIPELTHVINYCLPDEPETYIHRIGRTGRAGKEGLAVTFVTPREFRKLAFIKKIAKSDIEKRRIPTIEDIIAVKKKSLLDDLLKRIEDAENGKCPDSMFSLAKLLAESHHTTNIIAALLTDKYGRMVDLSSYQPVTDLFDHRERPERRPKLELRPRRDRRRPMVADKRREKPRQEVKKPSRTKKKANTSRFK
jgi:ATP-dependent RNA helicase DeaD